MYFPFLVFYLSLCPSSFCMYLDQGGDNAVNKYSKRYQVGRAQGGHDIVKLVHYKRYR